MVEVTRFEPATSVSRTLRDCLGDLVHARADAHGRERTHGGATLLLYFAAVLTLPQSVRADHRKAFVSVIPADS